MTQAARRPTSQRVSEGGASRVFKLGRTQPICSEPHTRRQIRTDGEDQMKRSGTLPTPVPRGRRDEKRTATIAPLFRGPNATLNGPINPERSI